LADTREELGQAHASIMAPAVSREELALRVLIFAWGERLGAALQRSQFQSEKQVPGAELRRVLMPAPAPMNPL
jgi:hypothetical protein